MVFRVFETGILGESGLEGSQRQGFGGLVAFRV